MATNAGQPFNQEGCVMEWIDFFTGLAGILGATSFLIIWGAIIPDSIGLKRRIIELEEQQQELKRKVARLNEKNFS